MPAATEMRSTTLALATVLALAAPLAPAPAAVGDFRLPSTTSEQQQPPPDRQGPVAPDVPESRRPAPTPTPAASTPAPEPVVTPPPILVPTIPGATPSAAPTRRPPAAGASVPPVASPTLPAPADAMPATTEALPGFDTATAPPAPAPAPAAAQEPSPVPWPWIAGGIAVLAGLGLAGWALRRRKPGIRKVAVPEIERPRVAPEPAPPASTPLPSPAFAAAPDPGPAEPLQVTLEPLSLSLTLMNATLTYRLEIANRGPQPLSGLSIGADMISAHASMTREEQLSGPNGAGRPQRIERLEPGESRVIEGEFRLPFGQIVPIRQGNAALLMPLARFRVEAEGARPVVRTFAVGQPGNGSALQPFRLDLGPRIYPTLTQHAFA